MTGESTGGPAHLKQTSVYGIKSQQKNNLPQFYEEIISHFKAETCLKPWSVILSDCQTQSHSQGI